MEVGREPAPALLHLMHAPMSPLSPPRLREREEEEESGSSPPPGSSAELHRTPGSSRGRVRVDGGRQRQAVPGASARAKAFKAGMGAGGDGASEFRSVRVREDEQRACKRARAAARENGGGVSAVGMGEQRRRGCDRRGQPGADAGAAVREEAKQASSGGGGGGQWRRPVGRARGRRYGVEKKIKITEDDMWGPYFIIANGIK